VLRVRLTDSREMDTSFVAPHGSQKQSSNCVDGT
jgi:hypothetical protein